LFGGYNRYIWGEQLLRAARSLPRGLRQPIAAALRAMSPGGWTRHVKRLPLPQAMLVGDKLQKVAQLLDDPEPAAFYRTLVSQWQQPEAIAMRGREPAGRLSDAKLAEDFPDFVARMQYLDLVTYLPDDILTKVDRATMAVGLEGRVPLLDHRVVAYAWTLPHSFKVRGGESKWLLRRVLDRYVPKRLIDRPKMGFAVPIDSWLRGPLRDWAETLLAPERLASDGLLRVEPVRRAWAEHLSGKRNWQHQLWTVLMLQAWRERWG
jgi:asparagine synthase (glutamine-hydrolysing)